MRGHLGRLPLVNNLLFHLFRFFPKRYLNLFPSYHHLCQKVIYMTPWPWLTRHTLLLFHQRPHHIPDPGAFETSDQRHEPGNMTWPTRRHRRRPLRFVTSFENFVFCGRWSLVRSYTLHLLIALLSSLGLQGRNWEICLRRLPLPPLGWLWQMAVPPLGWLWLWQAWRRTRV